MAVGFKDDEVEVACDACGVRLVSLLKMNLTLREALNFADDYQNPIFCRKCTKLPKPEEIPAVLH